MFVHCGLTLFTMMVVLIGIVYQMLLHLYWCCHMKMGKKCISDMA